MLKKMAELWKPISLIAIIVIAVTFASEFFIHWTEGQRHLIELIDLAAIVVLAIEFVLHFTLAEKKEKYLKENWLLATSFLPFGYILRALKAVKVFGRLIATWFSKIFHLVTHSPKVIRAYRAIAIGYSKAKQKMFKKNTLFSEEKRTQPPL